MNIDTLILQCFLAVTETGSFSKAATRINRTQSAVSQQIAKLENALNKSLFQRGRVFSLTPDGELFLGYAKQIIGLHREVIDRFREPELTGEVRFGMPEDFASVYLSDVLIAFSRIHPRILVNIECDLTLNLFKRLKRHEFDLVLLKMNRPEGFSSIDVCTEKLKWVGESTFIKRNKKTALPLVLSPEPCVYRARATKALDDAGIKWRSVFSSPSYAGTIAAVKAGVGITVLPRNMIPNELNILNSTALPKLKNSHVCLLKHDPGNAALLSFEKFVLAKLKFDKNFDKK